MTKVVGVLDAYGAPIFDYVSMRRRARAARAVYLGADPFPHIVLDGFFPAGLLPLLESQVPAPGDPVGWRRMDRTLPGPGVVQEGKLGLAAEFSVPPLFRRMFWELNSPAFLEVLEELTGITGLLPDPSLQGSGIHQVLPGGVLAVHADFTWHKVYAMKRRINVLLYLNHDWRENYGGHLQLWSPDLSRCARRIMPLMGRCVVFSTSDTSFHGHPEPVACPPGRTRKSIAMYYYTAERDDTAVADTRKTEWQVVSQHALPPVE